MNGNASSHAVGAMPYFRTATEAIYRNWAALQLAIQQVAGALVLVDLIESGHFAPDPVV